MKKVTLKNLAVNSGCKISSAEKKQIKGGYDYQVPIRPEEMLCSEGTVKYSIWGCSQTGWFTTCLPCSDSRVQGHPSCSKQIIVIDDFPFIRP